MAYWLMKSEPDELSIKDLQKTRRSALGRCAQLPGAQFHACHGRGRRVLLLSLKLPRAGDCRSRPKIAQAAYPDPTALDPDSHYFDPKASPGEKSVERTASRPRRTPSPTCSSSTT
jgi:hypothetical protein